MYEFYGEKICCGTYAFLNLVQDRRIEEDWFELSLSVPFGIVHKRYPRYDHLLTPFCNPNQGMDGAVRLWGYGFVRKDFASGHDAVRYMKNELTAGQAVMVGPIDMGRIYYQPLTYLYRRLDHFIVVCILDDAYVEIVDSEGILWDRCSFTQLEHMLSVQEIVEAGGQITVRAVQKERETDLDYILKESFMRACENMKKCQETAEGQNAFVKCCDYLEQAEYKRWGTALLYDISYLMQRKILCAKFFHKMCDRRMISSEIYHDWNEIVKEQLMLLGELFGKVRGEKHLPKEECARADDLEKMLGEKMLVQMKGSLEKI